MDNLGKLFRGMLSVGGRASIIVLCSSLTFTFFFCYFEFWNPYIPFFFMNNVYADHIVYYS